MRAQPSMIFVLLTLAACSADPKETGQKAGAMYMVPFGMSLGIETVGKPCSERLKLAKELSVSSMDKRKEVGAKAKTAEPREEFKSAAEAATKDRQAIFTEFAKKCPGEAKESIPVFQQVEEQLGLSGVLPALEVP